MSKPLKKSLLAAAQRELDSVEELYAEGGAHLLGGCDGSGSDSGSGRGGGGGGGGRNDLSCREFLRREGIDIGDTVVILTEGGTVITGVLVAEVNDRFVRVLTTMGNGIPANTLLIVDCRDIAAAGETLDLGNGTTV